MQQPDFFRTRGKSITALVALALAAVIGFCDYLTGWETSLFVFYAVPIFFVTWFGDRRWGIVLAMVCGVIWFAANLESHPYHSRVSYVWAMLNRAIYFAFVAVGSAAMRRQGEEAREKIEALTRSRELEHELVRSSEREQMRIGQDLHDGVCQSLAAIDCATECLKTDLERARLPQVEAAVVIQKMLQATLVDARSLARGLFPVAMDTHGLPVAIGELVALTNQLRTATVTFATQGEILIENREVSMHLYRIAQEALSNAVRHSGATRIAVSLRTDGAVLDLTIDDDGRGFPVSRDSSEGMGLRTMTYRAHTIGATLEVKSSLSSGTSISCSLAVSHESQAQKFAA